MTCSYAHRMKNTRAHAPILDVLAAAGVHGLTPPPTVHRREDSETWRGRRSEERAGSKREKRSCDLPEFCNIENPYDRPSRRSTSTRRSASTTRRSGEERRRHVRDVVTTDGETEEERERERASARRRTSDTTTRSRPSNVKKAPRSYRVANPDRVRPPRSESTEKYEVWRPKNAPKTMSDYEADEAYMLTHEVLAYSFSNNIN